MNTFYINWFAFLAKDSQFPYLRHHTQLQKGFHNLEEKNGNLSYLLLDEFETLLSFIYPFECSFFQALYNRGHNWLKTFNKSSETKKPNHENFEYHEEL